jgi:hypothetical protein
MTSTRSAHIRDTIISGAKATISHWLAFENTKGWASGMSREVSGSCNTSIRHARSGIAKYEPSRWFGSLTGADRKFIQRELEKMEAEGLIERINEWGRTSHIRLLKTDANTNKLTAGVTGKESL